MKRRIHFLCIGLAAALAWGPRAAAESSFAVDVWRTADGLPQSSVIALAQTHDGYLWLGTLNGLVRFDGNSFTKFNVNNTPGLPGNKIIFLHEDWRANLWAVTDNGVLCLIKNGELKKFDVSGASGKITAAHEDETGTVYFATDGADFFSWRSNVLERVSGAPDPMLTDLARHGRVPSKDGGYWLLKNWRVEKYGGRVLEKNLGAAPWGNAVVAAACEDAEGNLIVGTSGAGIYWFDAAGNFQRLTETNGLSKDYILALCFDAEKNLWVGTDGGGLDRVRKKSFSAPAALAGGVAQSVAEDAEGGLWTTFNLHGLTYWLTNSAQHFDLGRENKAWCVLVDDHAQVWAGANGEGLFHFKDGSFQPVLDALPVGAKIFSLFQNRAGKIWVGGENGLGCFDGERWKFFSGREGLPKSPVRALAEDMTGILWIGTESDGIYSLRDGKISAADAPVKDISTLLAVADGSLWAGTTVHGLAHFSGGEWKLFSSTLNGLANDDIGSLVEDDAGNLWVGSYEGSVRVEKKSLIGVASGAIKSLSCRTFLTREGSAGAQPSALRTRDGRLWFPTIEGLVSVNPADLGINTNPPPVIIESVSVDGVDLKTNLLGSGWRGAVTLTPENEQLEIHFTSLNFSAPKGSQFGARFKYWLEGRDKNWTDLRNERVVTLNRIEPGPYLFHVTACNEDGVWNEVGATLRITVEPPFWRKRSFVAAIICFALAAIGGIIYLVSTAKLKRQLRAARQKELIEKERARIARDLHDQLGANLTQVTLLGEMAELDKNLPDEIEQHAQQICATARETTRSLDEIVWAVNPSNDTLEGLANYACKYAQDYFALAGVSFRSELPAELPPTPILPEVRHNIFLAFKEAVNNVVKHAHATEARVKLEFEPDKFILSITDNGRGLGDISGKNLRNGLKNMRKRLADVRGEFDIAPGVNGGTVVKMTVPVKPKC